MRHLALLGVLSLAAAVPLACSRATDEPAQGEADAGEEASVAVLPPSGPPGPEGPAGTGSATGLPCDVQAVLENRCIACHDGKNQLALLSYSDLVAKSKSDPTKSLAEMSLARMKDAASPMPPKPAVPPEADEIQSFADWVAAGTPRETKACTDPPPDGGAPGDAGPLFDGGADGGVACTSGTFWNGGDRGSELMHPGRACNACHQAMGGPNLRVAGTVYPTLNEVDGCNGKGPPPQLTVEVTGADGRVFRLPVNGAGNFELGNMRPRAPFRARVTDGTKSRAMVGTVTSGDCNSCHTKDGRNGAPGRILAP